MDTQTLVCIYEAPAFTWPLTGRTYIYLLGSRDQLLNDDLSVSRHYTVGRNSEYGIINWEEFGKARPTLNRNTIPSSVTDACKYL
jgi:hypothetical protein